MLRYERQLSWPAIVEIAIHIEPAERPFNWVDRSILVAIKLLEMVVGQFRSMWVRNTDAKMISTTGIVTLGAFQHTVVHKIGSWLPNSLWHLLLSHLHTSMPLRTRQFGLDWFLLGLLLNSPGLTLTIENS